MSVTTFTQEIVQRAAKAAHEVNRAYCAGLLDKSQVPWDEAPQWQRDSAIKGVEAIIENPAITPEQQHECWLKEKVVNGWSYGPEKNEAWKQHPCMVHYDQLPDVQKAKDSLFGIVVRGVLGLWQ